ncbi:MAG: tRNA pseudouridine(55) synthase TruB [Flavobacteriales bacterium]|nr:tRNA pseudouridine(55) synthase TruB [Flavobacteriales bacterium]MCX7767729.1 tRNA pseudouridine(55) synthase TruB [Flavobacteriales bacterium]MDW8409376.1 tRNA pseudouridine(55) synthase TruB [Flavobacteriales bacterium]
MAKIPFEGQPEAGIYLLNKPSGWTSFDLVKFLHGCLSRHFKRRVKVGHAGTLDPLAQGLMVLASGPLTRELARLTSDDKEYEATLCLGQSTPSHDRETPVNERKPIPFLTVSDIENTLRKFEGEQFQTPPLYSAVKIQGRRAYQWARKGMSLSLKPRPIHIFRLQLLEWNSPYLSLYIHCSKGTYIRSLARDLGHALGTVAVLERLVRTRSGAYRLSDAASMEELKAFCQNFNPDCSELSENTL